jgi:lipopolysaccharide export system protein LptC
MSHEAALPPPAAAAAARGVAPPWRLRLLDLVQAYLPLLLMALLALGTWWLIKATPVPGEDRAEAPPRHEPDYAMTDFMVQRFAADGTLRAQIEGDMLRHFPDSDTLEIDNARIRALSVGGRVTIATAQRALANGDATEVQLQGGAHVTREAAGNDPAIEFRSEFLHAFLATERVRSHLPVTVVRGASRFSADAMEYDNLAHSIEFKGRMRAVFAAPVKGAVSALSAR